MIKSRRLWISVWALAAPVFSQSVSFPTEIVSEEIHEVLPGPASDARRPVPATRAIARLAPQASATGPGIVYVCDPGIPASACSYLNSTIAGLYASAFSNTNATIYVTFGATGLGMSQFPVFAVNYSDFRTALQQAQTSPDDATAFAASVPADNPISSAALVRLTAPLLRALGFASASTAVPGIQADLTSCATIGATGCYDGIITISKAFQDAGRLYYRTGIIGLNQADFYSTVEHETDEILGTPSCAFGCTNRIYPSDLYRYQGNGARSFAPGNNNNCFLGGSGNACFSLDGVHVLQQFNNINNGEDAGDWVPSCLVVLVQNAAACGGVGDVDISPAAEIPFLDVIGYTRTGAGLTPVQGITSGTVTSSGSCVAPPAVSQFTTTSPLVSVFVAVTGARVGDEAWIFFVRPDGAYNLQLATVTSVGPNGAACFSRQLPIASQVAAGYPGDWTILILWNDSNTPLLTLHFQLTGAACLYSFGSSGQAIEPLGGQGVLNISVASGCPWTLSGAPSWVTLLGTTSGSGRASIPFSVPVNPGSFRSGAITLAGSSFTFEQGALSAPGLAAIGSLAEVTSQGAWTFTLTAANLGATAAGTRFSFLADGGIPLQLPLTFPQVSSTAPPLLGSTLDRTLLSNAQIVIQSTGSAGSAALTGWGQLLSTGNVNGFGVFSFPGLKWNAAVPLETRNADRYTLAFDNTSSGANPLATGVAVANLAPAWADIPVVLRDDTGLLLATATLSLPAQGHTSFMLNQQYPVTAGRRGTIEFDTPGYSNLTGTHAGQISVLGVRTNGSALTTLPVFASGDGPGGSIAHVTYNGGFTSTFHLVNTGSTTASFTLSFFDSNGSPLSVPLLLPQSSTTTTTSALTKTLAPGAMLVVQTQSNDAEPNVSGSAQLNATGSLGGFEIFNWTTFGQEASVPLERRAPNSFVLLFDNTGSLTTGVALSNLASSAAAVTVKIYSDTGALLRTTTLNLPPNGHTSFMLPTAYTQAAGRRGMAEFVVPQGGGISAIGVRATASGTLTTIPMLVR